MIRNQIDEWVQLLSRSETLRRKDCSNMCSSVIAEVLSLILLSWVRLWTLHRYMGRKDILYCIWQSFEIVMKWYWFSAQLWSNSCSHLSNSENSFWLIGLTQRRKAKMVIQLCILLLSMAIYRFFDFLRDMEETWISQTTTIWICYMLQLKATNQLQSFTSINWRNLMWTQEITFYQLLYTGLVIQELLKQYPFW